MTPRDREVLRWGASLGVVLAVHLGGAAALLAWRVPQDPPASAPAVLLELAPLASAPSAEVKDVAPGPPQEISEPAPPDKPVEAPAIDTNELARLLPEPRPPEPVRLQDLNEQLPLPEAPPEVVIAVPPPPTPPVAKPPEPRTQRAEKPAPRKPETERKLHATQTTAPPAAAPARQSAAPALPPAIAREASPDVVRRWQASLVAHLQRYKRYPAVARANREQGTVYLRFTIDRNGVVLIKRLERVSGHQALDRETLELIDRAQPLPAPPPDMPGERFDLVVPVQFQLQ